MAKTKKPARTAKRAVVQVAMPKPAAEEPIFLIEYKNKLYLTAAVLEYDPKAKGISKEQARAIREMYKLLEGDHCLRAAPLMKTQGAVYSGANTFPMAYSGANTDPWSSGANTDPNDLGEGDGDDDDGDP